MADKKYNGVDKRAYPVTTPGVSDHTPQKGSNTSEIKHEHRLQAEKDKKQEYKKK